MNTFIHIITITDVKVNLESHFCRKNCCFLRFLCRFSEILYIEYHNRCTFFSVLSPLFVRCFPAPGGRMQKKNPLKSKQKDRRPCKGTGGGLLLGDSVCHSRRTVRFSAVLRGGLSKNDAFFRKRSDHAAVNRKMRP